MIPKPEQISRWASQEAAIKAEINEAKNTLDLMRMATAIARLDGSMQKWKRPQSSKTTTKPELRLALTKSGVSGSLCPTAKLRSRHDGRITGERGEKCLRLGDLRKFRLRRKPFQRTAENGLRFGSSIGQLIKLLKR